MGLDSSRILVLRLSMLLFSHSAYSSALMMETAGFSETLVMIYLSSWYQITNLHSHCHENCKSLLVFWDVVPCGLVNTVPNILDEPGVFSSTLNRETVDSCETVVPFYQATCITSQIIIILIITTVKPSNPISSFIQFHKWVLKECVERVSSSRILVKML